ncbi:EAL domain-containing protein [Vibrio hyugaensis]|uniref:EAL domain-containing protein n=1 Tax=Vibrio hyugaensis TaxID=1534743 RepID=UPI000CE417B8|nr:EAL domain-containing protein [Vibrio hyugaensis]
MPFSIQVNHKKTQFSTVYQPIIDLNSNKVVAMEVLSRSPSVACIERTLKLLSKKGKSREFTLALIKEIINESRLLPDSVCYISINITMDHMCMPEVCDDLEELTSTLCEQGVALVVELPEGEPYPMVDAPEARALLSNIKKLQDRGILIAIDDYGKGFNVGEAIVDYLMPDILKIDKNVVQKPSENKNVWSSLLSIMRATKIRVIAEGIENVKDLDFVKKTGICLCQGYYFGRPGSL